MRIIRADDQAARIKYLRWREEHDAAIGAFALDADFVRADESRFALTGLRRAIGHDHLIAAAGNDLALAVHKAANHIIGPRREVVPRHSRLRIRHATPLQIRRKHMIATTVGGGRSWKIDNGAGSERSVLARHDNVPRTDHIDTVRGATVIDNYLPTTRARR